MSVFEIINMSPVDLIDYLTRKGWSQERIALDAGVSQPTISRVRDGKHKRPRHTLVDRLREIVLVLEDM